MARIATFLMVVAMMLLVAFTTAITTNAAVFTVINTNPTGAGSLDAAIIAANATPGADFITFNISGPPYTIFPAVGGLTPLIDPAGVTIDGLTQPGASCSNPPMVTNLLIEIDGINSGPSHGIWIISSQNTIRGLVINNFEQHGIQIEGGGAGFANNADNNYIECCYIGTDPPGLAPKGNGRNQAALWAGVNIENQPDYNATYNRIENCLISANYAQGVQIYGPKVPGDVGFNDVLNCYIGIDAPGTGALGNRAEGVCLCEGAHDNTVSRCVISANVTDGVGMQGYDNVQYQAPPIYTVNNTVIDNVIGLSSTLNAMPNGMAGVAIGEYGPTQWGFAKRNRVEANIIATNGGDGVAVWEHPLTNENADENIITHNGIYSNGGLGIDLQNDGVTLNDVGDPDFLANEQMNFPIVLAATFSAGVTTILGTYEPGAATVEVFRASPDPTGYGEGDLYLGDAVLDGVGNWSFATNLLVVGDWVTTTARDAVNNTSEFSAILQVVQQQPDEACCLPDGSCTDLAPSVCLAQGGVPQGTGSQCTTPVACCLPDGSCQNLDSLCCYQLGGTPDPYGAGNCLGDNNGNQTDDACEPPLDSCEYYKAPYEDFALAGMPDFDQKQVNWWNAQYGNFSWCGPVALANCIWWFDSKFEPSPLDPRPFYPSAAAPTPNDGYPLVQSYEPTGGLWDDHDTNNVIPFISKLGPVCNTDIVAPGTPLPELELGFHRWLDTVGLTGAYTSFIQTGPTYEQIRDSVLSSQDVILLLGFYELTGQDPECVRVGGHYVTLAGVCTTSTDICISDPFFDKNEGEPPPGSVHTSSIHNDASLVSGPHGSIHHDRYNMVPVSVPQCQSPATWALSDYPNQWTADGIFTFGNLNAIDPSIPPVTYSGGQILVLVDAALIICPVDTSCCMEPMRGNINYDAADGIDISDLTFLVNWMFKNGPQPPCFEEMDVNCTGTMDIADLTYLVGYMFKNGPQPCPCQCSAPAPACLGP